MNFFKKTNPLDFSTLKYVKQLHRAEFAEWPFNTEHVKVAVLDTDYALIDISGAVFALNGLAATKYKLRNVQDTPFYITGEVPGTENAAGKCEIVGKFSLKPIIEIALHLDPKNVPGVRSVESLKG